LPPSQIVGPREPAEYAGYNNETHVSAQQIEARADPRISRPHGDQGRATRVETPTRKRPRPTNTVISILLRYELITTADKNSGLPGFSAFRFKKHSRLSNTAAFSRVFEKAMPSRDKWFTVLCADNDSNIARLGLAISKKHCRQATARNRLKRIVRESFRQHQGELAGLDVVVMNQVAATRAPNRCLFDSLDAHWQRCARMRGRASRQD